MRVLVATTELQGLTPGDYAHTVAGELVTATVTQCDCPDCGCDRGFAGLASHRATTTAMVVEHPHVTTSDLRDMIFDHLVAGGWLDLLRDAAEHHLDGDEGDGDDEPDLFDDPERAIEELVDEHLDVIAFVCNRFAPGTIVSRSGNLVWSREWTSAA
ncbi:MAG: hypothetical protein ABWZ99_03940 [Ilumatobacteraceae bacterium]